MREHLTTGFKGMFAAGSAGGGLAVSVATQVEPWLRVGALIAGIAVSVITFYSIWKKL
jgi:hypothetical protein